MLQLFGRVEAAARVRQAMAARGRPNPVLVFEGPPGSGKTSLLVALEELLHNRVPHAFFDVGGVRLDADRDEHGAIPPLVAELAFRLARQAGGYGALPFPRLVIGFLVQGLDLDRRDPERARRQVDEALRAHRGVDRWTSTLEEAAGQLVARVPGGQLVPPALVHGVLAGTVGLAGRWGPGRSFLLGRYQQWYGHQDLGLSDSANDALIGLKRWSDSAARNPDHQKLIDNLLMRAFLADLRDAFRRAERTGGWSYNAVLLLDNVDGELGEAFLTELVRIRRGVLAGGTAGQDPLTVVVTSRGALMAAVEDGAADPVDRPGRRDAQDREQFWQSVPLTPLTPTEISAMIAQLGLSDGNTQHLATIVHEFTRGQVAATELLLNAIDDEGRADIEPTALLWGPPGGTPLEHRLLDRLLDGIDAGPTDDLAVFAAARSREPVKRLARKLKLDKGRNSPETAPLWSSDDQEVTLVRRLLLRRLALDPARWDGTFETLRADAVEQKDADLQLYYAAGLGRWGAIAAALTERLTAGEMPAWLDSLHRTAAAPSRPLPGTEPPAPPPATEDADAEDADAESPDRTPPAPKPTVPKPRSPHDLAQRLAEPWTGAESLAGTGSPEKYLTVLNLLTALSVARDPVCGANRGGLYRRIADSYRELSEYPNLGCRELDVLERRYGRLARDWERTSPAATPGSH